MFRFRNAAMLLALGVGLAACRFEAGTDIPGSAKLVSEGNRELSYSPAERGTIYVYDDTDNRLLWSGRVNSGDRVVLEPNNNRLILNGDTIHRGDLNKGHQVRIYFDRH